MSESQYLQNFKAMIKRGGFVVLDTETTGLGHGAEICQIAIIDDHGQTLVDTLIKTVNPIPDDASRIHGITDAMVQNAPAWGDVLPELQKLLTGVNVVVYNATFDRGMMHKSNEANNLPKIDWKTLGPWWCAMEAFAEVYGDWNSYHKSYRWQRLAAAARYYRLPVENAHNALGDCLMTLGVVKAMVKQTDD